MSLKSINESFERQFNAVNDSKNEEFEVLESLRNLLSILNEAEMSDEDRRESDLIRSAYAKIQKRVNARLTPEEQAVLDKYGIQREYKDLKYATDHPNFDYSTNLVDNSDDRYMHGKTVGRYYSRKNPDGSTDYSRHGYTVTRDTDKINYADRARKRPERLKNREFNYTYSNNWSRDGYSDDVIGEIDYNIKPSAEDEITRRGISQNAAINRMSQSNLRKMQGLLDRRKDAQKDLDNAKAEYNKSKAANDANYMKKMQAAERDYDRSMDYAKREFDRKSNPERRDRAQSGIDAMLKRKKTEALDTESTRELIKNVRSSRDTFSALKTVYNSVLAGNNLGTGRGKGKKQKDLSGIEGTMTHALEADRSWEKASSPNEMADRIEQILAKVERPSKKNESLDEYDRFDFISDVYNALTNVAFTYHSHDKDISKEDFDRAYEWFSTHFWGR